MAYWMKVTTLIALLVQTSAFATQWTRYRNTHLAARNPEHDAAFLGAGERWSAGRSPRALGPPALRNAAAAAGADGGESEKLVNNLRMQPSLNGMGSTGLEERSTVIKFGGSSLATSDRLRHMAELVKGLRDQGDRPIMVCSAMGKTTNNLLSAADFALDGKVYIDALRTLHMLTAEEVRASNSTIVEIEGLLGELDHLLNGVSFLRELTPRTLDHLVSFGERLSVRLVAAALNSCGVPAQHMDAWSIGIRTTSQFGGADILPETFANIKQILGDRDPGIVYVVTGFIGHDLEGRITTLGRGGSDLTATCIGAALGVDEVQVWKDVDGILTADPRVVQAAVPVPEVSYEEAAELAYFGAKVLHPVSMLPAMRACIPVRVKNSYNPEHPGTLIKKQRSGDQLATAITVKNGITLIDVVSTRMLGAYGFLSKVFGLFEKHQKSVDMVATSEVSVSLTLEKKQQESGLDALVEDLEEFSEVKIKHGRSIVSIICNLDRSSEVMAYVFQIMDKIGVKVQMLSQGASKVNIGLVIDSESVDDTIKALHACFFEECEEGCPLLVSTKKGDLSLKA
mmetsp:Transcript_13868/g.20447  ORF Transcript_13868/g.20447 Transcript_13868/m.20447 type:complete len:569 (-) Transcript_13868:226-1932(-)|eukprot:CAMPEP_0113943220 /NCGR_PEP_ID=MMETSP1339-20121228/21052_1 /TAXON_ID=94617 /ORGANISM="Fibrocapsa japonica" /LENGTH=568 /DNA_ID=CAMNT_0000948033 /DNA_START=35 /DNA_END=1741 /DNA_ORIENTATION=- /assembly_acc=CAM_ASM_000762